MIPFGADEEPSRDEPREAREARPSGPDASDEIETNWDTIVERFFLSRSFSYSSPFPRHHSFDDMNLKEDLLRGIYAYGFEKPSAIQQRAILPVASGRDTIAQVSSSIHLCLMVDFDIWSLFQAQSGTGKTATFTIGVLQGIDEKLNKCQALLLAPTRELAQQIHKVVLALGDYMRIKAIACVGGTAIRDDVRMLSEGVHVVVGTPGMISSLPHTHTPHTFPHLL